MRITAIGLILILLMASFIAMIPMNSGAVVREVKDNITAASDTSAWSLVSSIGGGSPSITYNAINQSFEFTRGTWARQHNIGARWRPKDIFFNMSQSTIASSGLWIEYSDYWGAQTSFGWSQSIQFEDFLLKQPEKTHLKFPNFQSPDNRVHIHIDYSTGLITWNVFGEFNEWHMTHGLFSDNQTSTWDNMMIIVVADVQTELFDYNVVYEYVRGIFIDQEEFTFTNQLQIPMKINAGEIADTYTLKYSANYTSAENPSYRLRYYDTFDTNTTYWHYSGGTMEISNGEVVETTSGATLFETNDHFNIDTVKFKGKGTTESDNFRIRFINDEADGYWIVLDDTAIRVGTIINNTLQPFYTNLAVTEINTHQYAEYQITFSGEDMIVNREGITQNTTTTIPTNPSFVTLDELMHVKISVSGVGALHMDYIDIQSKPDYVDIELSKESFTLLEGESEDTILYINTTGLKGNDEITFDIYLLNGTGRTVATISSVPAEQEEAAPPTPISTASLLGIVVVIIVALLVALIGFTKRGRDAYCNLTASKEGFCEEEKRE